MSTTTLDDRTHAWLAERFWRDDELLADARERFREIGPSIEVPIETGALLATLVRATGARRILEVGTLFGYSTTWMARALPDDGHIDTLELVPEHAAFARELLREAGLAERVVVHQGDARETLARLQGPYDLVFIDADKEGYVDYLDRALEIVRPGGTIIADNVIWSGRVADPSNDESGTQALRSYLERVMHHPQLDTNVLPVGDGVAISIRR
jgi:predicted O-methyltransferase YrrM